MSTDIILNQLCLLLSTLTPLARKNIAYAIMDMFTDAVGISELEADPKVIEPIMTSIRMACDNDI